jgi:hypothetical protein
MVRSKSAAQPAMSVAKIANEAQKSQVAHKKCAKLLWELFHREGQACFEELTQCLQHVLLVSQVRWNWEHGQGLLFQLFPPMPCCRACGSAKLPHSLGNFSLK